MARRPRAAVVAAVSWRDGVHLTGTPIWCDARRRRDVCFVSSASPASAHGVTRGHGQLIATSLTLALLGAGDDPISGHLAVPLMRRFTLGTLRLELIASGRGLGAASLYVDIAGRGVLYADAIRKDVPMLGGAYAIAPADVRACDAVVVAAPHANAPDALPPLAQTIDRVESWCRAELAAGRRPVLLVDSALDGAEVVAVLAGRELVLAAHRRIRDALIAFEHAAWTNASLDPASVAASVRTPARELRPTVWLASERAALARTLAQQPHAIATLSGAREATFAWSSSAGKLELMEWIEATGARHVYLTGPGAAKLAEVLGPRARVIGPPQQMSLAGFG